ncbi:MAG: hypothetical protein KC645_18215 [Gemmatimonadetes bacterium]|nr:hypothetical protein [Gemmatimonadota bacterium]
MPRRRLERIHALLPWTRRRRFHAYCVGTPKSGTHSMAALFQAGFRASHEPESAWLIERIMERGEHRPSPSELRRALRRRDRLLRLELDSSQLNYFILDDLLDLFPKARFILTLRECLSWLDSYLNDCLARPASERWHRFRAFRFAADSGVHPPEEVALARRGLFTLEAYLRYWTRHNEHVLRAVPPGRLLVVPTREIGTRIPEIAGFLHIDPAQLDPDRSHAYHAQAHHDVLDEIPTGYLADVVTRTCGDLMQRFFPEELARLHAGRLPLLRASG